METECSTCCLEFQPLGRRQVTARFDGGTITSDAGGLLLREVEAASGLLAGLATCFDDHRDPELIEHSVEALIKQRVFALALGYEDLNDHDQLRADPLLAVLVGKEDPTGQDRVEARDRGKPLAGKSTLNRLELTPVGADAGHRYKKIVARHARIERWFVEAFLTLTREPPAEIVLDLDATDFQSICIIVRRLKRNGCKLRVCLRDHGNQWKRRLHQEALRRGSGAANYFRLWESYHTWFKRKKPARPSAAAAEKTR